MRARRLAAGLFWAVLLAPGAALIGPPLAAMAMGGQSLTVPAGSMLPALMAGDRILTTGFDAGADLRRGAVVVFALPTNPETAYVKRIVALPGERVQLKDGIVHVDGVAAGMTRAGVAPVPRADLPGTMTCLPDPAADADPDPDRGLDRCHLARWIEDLPGTPPHAVLDGGPHIGDDTDEIAVPSGHVFVLGDNRDLSADSRAPGFGTIPVEAMAGRAWMVHYSLDGWRPRPDRLFRRID